MSSSLFDCLPVCLFLLFTLSVTLSFVMLVLMCHLLSATLPPFLSLRTETSFISTSVKSFANTLDFRKPKSIQTSYVYACHEVTLFTQTIIIFT